MKFFDVKNNESIPNINKTPTKPIKIDINFKIENLSSLVMKWENIRAKIGAIDNNNPAVFDLIYISAQLIKENGIKLPIRAIKKIYLISLKENLKLSFL